jgi:2-isopropylmalate synthase
MHGATYIVDVAFFRETLTNENVVVDIGAAHEALGGLSIFKRAVTLFVGISKLHREQKHKKTKAEIVQMTVDAIQYAKQHFRIVTFGPEDASRTEPEYLHEIYD